MSDENSQSTGTAGDGSTRSEARGDHADRSGESWIDRLRAVVGWKTSPGALRENLEEALEQDAPGEEGGFSAEERAMIRNILALRETRVGDVMLARADIDGIAEDTPLDRLLLAFLESGHSRMPVYRESLDDAIGMVHIRDLMGHIARASVADGGEGTPRIELGRADLSRRLADTDLVRPVLFVPGSMFATDLLARMRHERIQMALVIDEYGGVEGLCSMEDIVETVVGDIEDEHDVAEEVAIAAAGPGLWIADARAELAEVAEKIGLDVEAIGLDEEVETLGGLVVSLAGRVPETGEIFTDERLAGLEVEVLDADARRLKKLRLHRVVKAAEPVAT